MSTLICWLAGHRFTEWYNGGFSRFRWCLRCPKRESERLTLVGWERKS